MAAPSTPTSELHGITGFKIKILVAMRRKEQIKSGRLASKVPATTSRTACRFLSNRRSRKE